MNAETLCIILDNNETFHKESLQCAVAALENAGYDWENPSENQAAEYYYAAIGNAIADWLRDEVEFTEIESELLASILSETISHFDVREIGNHFWESASQFHSK